MRRLTIVALAAGIALSGCGKSEPVKRQPGSWSTKIELTKFEGPDAKPGAKEQMQAMFNMMGGMSLCLDKDAVEQEDIAKNLQQSAGSRSCKPERNDFSGTKVDYAATCEENGKKVKMTATGTKTATSQDVTLNIQSLDAAGKTESTMEMHVTNTRNGECKATDITPPKPTATAPVKQ